MEESTETLPIDASNEPQPSRWERGQWLLARCVAWGATTNWRITVEWSAVRPVLVRYTAHLSILLLAIAAMFITQVRFPQAAASGEPSPTHVKLDSTFQGPFIRQARLSQATPTSSDPVFGRPDDGTITRLALPQTNIPERPRNQVMTYTVQAGDTVFGIAEAFKLTPYTIYWANSETLEDNPHRLSVGMVLNILPVDGVYHVVTEGETAAGLADEYGVALGALYNEWNELEQDQPLAAGMRLVVPGGEREFVVWQLPRAVASNGGPASNGGRAGMCVGSYSGLPGRGWFNWPTAGRRISGYYFRDARNPAHSGLDIGLHLGEPVYAADGGIIIFAGWWGANGYGNLVVVDHLNGWQSWYGHLSQVNVFCGQQVNAGDVIALGGSTGWSSGPHLHLEIRLDGVPYDPLAYLP
jgi:murein DD-endopeptidase MepM/ murein hydrolase activator NlpD